MATAQNFIGPFQLIRLIRSGSTTQVWEALREGETERVALKMLHKEFATNKKEIDQLKLETEVGKALDHPHVIKIFDYFEQYRLPFVSMQLFNARNLKLELRENPDFVELNLPQIIRYAGEGLQHLHERGWLHCDVKPDNFLADEQANVKLIDFSIAQKIKKPGFGWNLFRARTFSGTRSYVSPEQIRRQTLDPRADLYSFGCVIFELIAKRPPFTGSNQDELLNKHLRATPPSIQSSDPRVSNEFAELLGKLLHKKRDQRPDSVRDFLYQMERVQIFRAGTRRRSVK